MTPDFFYFSFYYPVRNFILKYEYSSSPIYKNHTSFSVGRWLRFFDVLVYRSNVQLALTPKKLILTSNYCAHVKKYNSAIICDLNCRCPTTFYVIMGRKVPKTVEIRGATGWCHFRVVRWRHQTNLYVSRKQRCCPTKTSKIYFHVSYFDF